MTRAVPSICVDFLLKAEALKLQAYQDSKGVWTIGVGHTAGVAKGQTITRAQAMDFCRQDAAHAAWLVSRVVQAHVIDELTEHEWSALISFAFNLGVVDSWTIWKKLNAGDLDAVPAQLARFNQITVSQKPKITRVLPGLVARRAAEIHLWETPDVAGAVVIAKVPDGVIALPSSETRAAHTPPAVEPKPLATASLTTKLVGFVAAAGVGAQQVLPLVEPHKDMSPIFAQLAIALTMVVVVAGAVGLFISNQQHKAATQ